MSTAIRTAGSAQGPRRGTITTKTRNKNTVLGQHEIIMMLCDSVYGINARFSADDAHQSDKPRHTMLACVHDVGQRRPART